MKITSITVANFKSFSKTEKLEFFGINFIFGFNNSGKSNLLKLIDTIFSRKIISESTEYETKDGTAIRVKEEKGNFWEGIIENHNNIFRFGAAKGIEFEVSVQLTQKEISGLSIYPDLIKEQLISKDNPIDIIISGDINPLGQYDAKQELHKVSINGKIVYGPL